MILRGTAQRDATHAEMHEVDSYLRQRIRQSNAESSRAATVAAVGAGRLTVEAFSVDVSGER